MKREEGVEWVYVFTGSRIGRNDEYMQRCSKMFLASGDRT